MGNDICIDLDQSLQIMYIRMLIEMRQQMVKLEDELQATEDQKMRLEVNMQPDHIMHIRMLRDEATDGGVGG